MRTLGKLVRAIRSSGQQVAWAGQADTPVLGVTGDSRRVSPGSVFVAVKGALVDGHAYVHEAIAQGCCAVVVEKSPVGIEPGAVIRVEDTHLAYGFLAAAYYGYPAREMTIIGLTGTNGKTTTAWIIEQMLMAAGKQTGVLGTVNYRYADSEGKQVVTDAPLTTPEPVTLHGLLRNMRDAGVTHVVMEVSSHALAQQRLAGMQFDVAVFTNLSRDHLDYHLNMGDYFSAKQKLFLEYLAPRGKAVVVDDGQSPGAPGEGISWGKKLIRDLEAEGFDRYGGKSGSRLIITCGLQKDLTVRAEKVRQDINGFAADFVVSDKKVGVHSGLIGRHNILNMLTAAGVGLGLKLKPTLISKGLEGVEQVPGRLERILLPPYRHNKKVPTVFVDYAHTPDALENVLQTLQSNTRGQLYCVFGCGGDRDRGKRVMMGRLAGEYAHRVVLTSDNPRTEDPAAIIREVEPGLLESGISPVEPVALFQHRSVEKIYTVIEDRRQAIHTACNAAGEGDVVLVAGKGHETCQITAAGKRFFDDRLEARNSQLRWTASRLAAATSGTLVQPGKTHLFGEISTDTRTIKPGDVFLALQGENYDGHDFLAAALAKGASALILKRAYPVKDQEVGVIRVEHTLQALGDLAHYRRGLLAPELRVIGITGSSGKTTVKEMTSAIFAEQDNSAAKETVLKTAGNFNNLIGLPLTLLRVDAGHRTAVLEMGMNRPGEIAELTRVSDPNIGCITNVQAAHLEGLGTIEGVARAKGELFSRMSGEGIRVINYDDPQIRKLGGRYGNNAIGFAVTPEGRRYRPAVRGTRIVNLGESGMRFTLHINSWRKRITVPSTGVHNVANCAAAAAIAVAAGVVPDVIARGLLSYRCGDKRQQIVELPGGIRVLNDSYNANPSSMAAALNTISQFGSSCRRVAVLGDMLELGEGAPDAHRRIGALVAELDFAYLAVTGDFRNYVAESARQGGMKKDRIISCVTTEDVARRIMALVQQKKIRPGDWLLLKGSRGMRMEQVLASFERMSGRERN